MLELLGGHAFHRVEIYEPDGAYADERLIAHDSEEQTNGGRTNSLESIWCM